MKKVRIFELEKAIEDKTRERNNLRERLRHVLRESERMDTLFPLKLESKERELRHFLLPSVPRSSACDVDANKNQNNTNCTISSTVRPVPTLVSGLTKPVDSLLGPAGSTTRTANPKGPGLLPTPYPNPSQAGNKAAVHNRSLPSTRFPQSSKCAVDSNELLSKDVPSYTDVLVDSSVNLVLSRLRRIQRSFDNLVASNQSELQSFTFTQNSQNGKRMMMRIRVLEHENEELANVNRTGRTARLESEIALRRAFVNDLKNAHADMEYLVEEAETETEVLGSSLMMLQQRLQLTQGTAEFLASELEKIESESCVQILGPTTNASGDNSLLDDRKPDNDCSFSPHQFHDPRDEGLYDEELIFNSEAGIGVLSSDSLQSEQIELMTRDDPSKSGEYSSRETETNCESESRTCIRSRRKLERNNSKDDNSPYKSKRSRISGNYNVSSDEKCKSHMDSLSFLPTPLSRHDTPTTERTKTRPVIPVRGPQRTFQSNREHNAPRIQTKSVLSSPPLLFESVATELLKSSNCNNQLSVSSPANLLV
ncbi:unnamed protein product [Heterobilharzia americana]|nr:unnamed protein product [Heterobilharzia americana]